MELSLLTTIFSVQEEARPSAGNGTEEEWSFEERGEGVM